MSKETIIVTPRGAGKREIDRLRADLAQRTAERDEAREQLRLANIDQFNSEAEVAALKAEVSRISLRWEIADHRVSLLWAERDEARREVCFAYGPMAEALAAAKRRDWDCFEREEGQR